MSLLISEPPLVVQPTLIRMLGLKKAHLLQQVQYWLAMSINNHDGYAWVYNTYDAWLEQLPFYGRSTLAKDIAELELVGVLVSTSKYNKSKSDRTKWYRVDYENLQKAIDQFIVQKLDYPSSNTRTIHSPEVDHSNHKTTTENIDIEEEVTPSVVTLATTKKSGVKPKKKFTGVTTEQVILDVEKKKISNKGLWVINKNTPFAMASFWKHVLSEEYSGDSAKEFTAKELGQFKLILKSFPESTTPLEGVVYGWSGFISFVASSAGITKLPARPTIGFLLTHVGLVIPYTHVKQESLHASAKKPLLTKVPLLKKTKVFVKPTLEELAELDKEIIKELHNDS